MEQPASQFQHGHVKEHPDQIQHDHVEEHPDQIQHGHVKEGSRPKLQDKDQVQDQRTSNPISMPPRLMTRTRAKKLQQEFIHHLQGLMNLASEGL